MLKILSTCVPGLLFLKPTDGIVEYRSVFIEYSILHELTPSGN